MRNTAHMGRPGPFPSDMVKAIQLVVVGWFDENGREFPWRETSIPYHILVAEVLLRRTQADRVERYYRELIQWYPTLQDMSEADAGRLSEWFKPLGLTKRADHLIQTANITLKQYGGNVPQTLEQLSALPGIGRYSARAIQCLAFGVPVPMVDEGSGRLMRRLLGVACRGPAYSDRNLLSLAESLVPADAARAFNLGLLDIAAYYCHAGSPDCAGCPLQALCACGQGGQASQAIGDT